MKKNTDYILIGILMTTFVTTAVSTLQTAFILSMSLSVYQFIMFSTNILAMFTTIIIKRFNKICNIFYNNIKTFLFIEGAIDLVIGVLTLIFKTPMIAAIAAIILTPLGHLQQLSLNRIMSELFDKEERLEHDDKLTNYSKIITVLAGVLGFVCNKILDGPSSYALICLVEIANNIFYIKQINKYKKK